MSFSHPPHSGISRHRHYMAYLVFCAVLCLNTGLWLKTRMVLPEWGNVPPAPPIEKAGLAGLGDPQAAYRFYGYMLQNLGNTGGRTEGLRDYDYAAVEKWMDVTHALNPRSDFVPVLAAYYFGAVEDRPEKIAHMVNYLAMAGEDPYPQKWRWLAQAVYLARYKEKNLPRALELAERLASLKGDVAPWARQMPAFVQLEMGNKEAAYEVMIRMLATEQDNLHPNEVNFMRDFICTRTLDKVAAQKNPLCNDIP